MHFLNSIIGFLKKGSLIFYTVLFALVGIVFGLVLSVVNARKYPILMTWLALPGMLFVRSLVCLAIPLVFTSVVTGVANIFEVGSALKKLATYTIGYFFITTIICIILSLSAGLIVRAITKADDKQISLSPMSAYWDHNVDILITNRNYDENSGYYNSTSANKVQYRYANDPSDHFDEAPTYLYKNKIGFTVKAKNDIGFLRDIVVLSEHDIVTLEVPDQSFDFMDYPLVNEISESLLNLSYSLIPGNMIGAALGCPPGGCSPNLLSLIMLAIVIALYISLYERERNAHGDPSQPQVKSVLLPVITELMEVFLRCVILILYITPVAVFCLVSTAIGANALSDLGSVLSSLGISLVALFICILIHVFVAYPGLVFFATRQNPYPKFSYFRQPITISLATASSASTFPTNLQACYDLGLCPPVFRFILSLGNTVHMNGVSIYLPVAILWLAQVSGQTISLAQLVLLGIVAILISLGASPVPGLVPYALMSWSALFGNIPVPSQVSYLLALDWLLDRIITFLNIFGDSVVAIIVSHYLAPEINSGALQLDGLDKFADPEVDAAQDKKPFLGKQRSHLGV